MAKNYWEKAKDRVLEIVPSAVLNDTEFGGVKYFAIKHKYPSGGKPGAFFAIVFPGQKGAELGSVMQFHLATGEDWKPLSEKFSIQIKRSKVWENLKGKEAFFVEVKTMDFLKLNEDQQERFVKFVFENRKTLVGKLKFDF